MNEPYAPTSNNFVAYESDICSQINEWHTAADHFTYNDFTYCGYQVNYVDDSVARGVWINDLINYKTYTDPNAIHSFEANFGYIYK